MPGSEPDSGNPTVWDATQSTIREIANVRGSAAPSRSVRLAAKANGSMSASAAGVQEQTEASIDVKALVRTLLTHPTLSQELLEELDSTCKITTDDDMAVRLLTAHDDPEYKNMLCKDRRHWERLRDYQTPPKSPVIHGGDG